MGAGSVPPKSRSSAGGSGSIWTRGTSGRNAHPNRSQKFFLAQALAQNLLVQRLAESGGDERAVASRCLLAPPGEANQERVDGQEHFALLDIGRAAIARPQPAVRAAAQPRPHWIQDDVSA